MTSLASEYLPIGLGAQLAVPTLVMSAVEVVGEAGVVVVVAGGSGGGGGGGGGGGVLDDELEDDELEDDKLEDVGVFDEDPKVGLFVTALGTGTLRT